MGRTFRVRVYRNTAGELHYLVGEPQPTDYIVYGELVAAAKVTWKPDGQRLFLQALADMAMKAAHQR